MLETCVLNNFSFNNEAMFLRQTLSL